MHALLYGFPCSFLGCKSVYWGLLLLLLVVHASDPLCWGRCKQDIYFHMQEKVSGSSLRREEKIPPAGWDQGSTTSSILFQEWSIRCFWGVYNRVVSLSRGMGSGFHPDRSAPNIKIRSKPVLFTSSPSRERGLGDTDQAIKPSESLALAGLGMFHTQQIDWGCFTPHTCWTTTPQVVLCQFIIIKRKGF